AFTPSGGLLPLGFISGGNVMLAADDLSYEAAGYRPMYVATKSTGTAHAVLGLGQYNSLRIVTSADGTEGYAMSILANIETGGQTGTRSDALAPLSSTSIVALLAKDASLYGNVAMVPSGAVNASTAWFASFSASGGSIFQQPATYSPF